MPFITELAQNTAGNAVNAGMGLVLGGINDRRQLKQQGKLQEQQMQGAKQMAAFNQQLQKDMWEYTGYGGQMRQMKEAGINPGLMYGMGGGGAQTIGSAGAQGPTGGEAPSGGGEAIAAMGIGTQQRLMQAQENLINAQTEKTKAETTKTSGVDTKVGEAQAASLTQGVENSKAQQELTEIQSNIARIEEHIKGETQNAAIAAVMTELKSATFKMNMLETERDINAATKQQKIEMVGAELSGAYARAALMRSDIKVNEAQIGKIGQEITNMIGELSAKWYSLSIEEQRVALQERLVKFNTAISQRTYDNILKGLNTISGAIRPGTVINQGPKTTEIKEINHW